MTPGRPQTRIPAAGQRRGRESVARGTRRASEILARLKEAYPEAGCALQYQNSLELLVATILSAQCTDVRVNMVTPALFARCRTAVDYADIPTVELETLIQSAGFFRNKAKSLRGLGRALLDHHGGEVPRTLAELVELPGVGRKTANVVLGNAFGLDEGIVVDTHVGRLSGRLALTRSIDPVRVELDLVPLFPRAAWTLVAHLLIAHGRKICRARTPICGACILADLCPSARS